MTARVVVVGAPASGSGKTTVATGLMAALRRSGRVVAPFKVGPDYIDPGYHTLAAGRPGRNLDPVLVGADRIGSLLRHGAAGADVAVVEGVMGLFDGRLADGHGSTAHVAALIGAPVVLVVDCRGQSRSLAALLHGFRSFDETVHIAGVVLNRVGSERHVEVLRAAAAEVGLPVFGALPRRPELAVPSRHLGLVTAVEHGRAALAAVDAMAALVAEHVDLDAVLRAAAPLPPGPVWDAAEVVRGTEVVGGPADVGGAGLVAGPTDGGGAGLVGGLADGGGAGLVGGLADGGGPGLVAGPGIAGAARVVGGAGVVVGPAVVGGAGSGGGRPIVAVAGGPAFTFGYAEHAELLRAAGAEVVVVDPSRDEWLPAGTAALVLPGGFPEEHGAALGANVPLRTAVRELARSGAPVVAECGGLLYLCSELDGAPMCGVLPAAAAMTAGVTLGYRHAVALTASAGFAAGQRAAGHEFHHCSVTPRAGAAPAWGWQGAEPEGFVVGGVHASFLHTHPAGNPAAVARFVAAARDHTAGT